MPLKDVLIITNYYPPEMGAASNRIYNLATGLSERCYKVSVVTPLPNYPHGRIFSEYKKGKKVEEKSDIIVYHLSVYASNAKNRFKRLLAMLSYSVSLIRFFLTHKIPNTVIIQSPPLLVAFTSIFFLRSRRRKLILNVSDLWPLAGLELGVLKNNFTYKILNRIEHFNYKNASLILGQSNEILAHIKLSFPKKETFLYRNYPKVLDVEISQPSTNSSKLRIVYAGLLGHAQGILELIKNLDYNNIELHIYGSGAEKEQIEALLNQDLSLAVEYHGELPRKELLKKAQEYDVVVIPLIKRIYGSVPSKIFEFALLGIPILYFGGGEGERIVYDNNFGWTVKPGDFQKLNQTIASFNKEDLSESLRLSIREKAKMVFNLSSQIDDLVTTIN